MKISRQQIAWLKYLIIFICLLPFLFLIAGFYLNRLGANPLETLTHETGLWCLRFLLITLLMTPLKLILKLNFVIQFRRMFGLYAYFYGVLHLVTYVWFDQFFAFSDIWLDIQARPFIAVGFFSMLLMTPLAITSSDWMIKKMGGKNWQLLHKMVYIVAILACVHYLWLVKINITSPLYYTAILTILLGIRVLFWVKKSRIKNKKLSKNQI